MNNYLPYNPNLARKRNPWDLQTEDGPTLQGDFTVPLNDPSALDTLEENSTPPSAYSTYQEIASHPYVPPEPTGVRKVLGGIASLFAPRVGAMIQEGFNVGRDAAQYQQNLALAKSAAEMEEKKRRLDIDEEYKNALLKDRQVNEQLTRRTSALQEADRAKARPMPAPLNVPATAAYIPPTNPTSKPPVGPMAPLGVNDLPIRSYTPPQSLNLMPITWGTRTIPGVASLGLPQETLAVPSAADLAYEANQAKDEDRQNKIEAEMTATPKALSNYFTKQGEALPAKMGKGDLDRYTRIMEADLGRKQQAVNITLRNETNAGGIKPVASLGEGADPLADLNPADRNIVKAIGTYRQKLPATGRNNPYNREIMRRVALAFPSFDETKFNDRNRVRQAYDSGKQSIEINAMNTVLGHVDTLDKASVALQNGDLRGLNWIANNLGIQSGNDAQVVYNTIVHRIGPELTRAYVGAGGDSKERLEAGGDFNMNSSPRQIHGAAKITAKLLGSKINASLYAYRRAMGIPQTGKEAEQVADDFFTPEARGAMDRMVGQGWKAGVIAPAPAAPDQGGTKVHVQIPGHPDAWIDADKLDAFKKKYPEGKVL